MGAVIPVKVRKLKFISNMIIRANCQFLPIQRMIEENPQKYKFPTKLPEITALKVTFPPYPVHISLA